MAAGSTPPRAVRVLTLVLLAAATVAAFGGVLRNGWILFDDPNYVVDNPHVNRGLTLTGVLWFLHQPHGGNWHPLTSVSHMLDVQIFGLMPAGHHATSLALHMLNALLLLIVLDRMTGAWWRSALVAGFFALHPLRVESVAWISERKDVLCMLFFLLTLEAYRRWVERPDRTRAGLVVSGLALGLMSKPMLVTLPFLLVLLDIWPLGRLAATTWSSGPTACARPERAPARPLLGLVREKWPLLALAAASAVVTFVVQRQTGAVVSAGVVAPGRRIANALITYWRYIGKSVWPSDLAVFYPFNRPIAAAAVLVAAAALACVTVLALRQLRKRPYLAVGWLWYLGTLVPVIGLIQVGGQAFADRYTYIPVIGLAIALVWGVGDALSTWRLGRISATIAAILTLAGLSVATACQVARWRDTRTLFTHALAVTRDNAVAHQNLGNALLKSGDIQGAIPHLQEALRMVPDFPDAHLNLGSALGALGRYDEAIDHFEAALRKQETADLRQDLGYALAKQGRTDEAIHEYEAAIRLDPEHYLSLVQLGTALRARGRLRESVVHLQRAVEMKPDSVETRRLLAVSLTLDGLVEDAIRQYGEILRRNPDDLDALNNVAWIRATHEDAGHRNGTEAVRLAERARNRSAEPVAVLFSTLAAAYAEAGRFPEAVAACQRAIELARTTGLVQEHERYVQQLAIYRTGKPLRLGR